MHIEHDLIVNTCISYVGCMSSSTGADDVGSRLEKPEVGTAYPASRHSIFLACTPPGATTGVRKADRFEPDDHKDIVRHGSRSLSATARTAHRTPLQTKRASRQGRLPTDEHGPIGEPVANVRANPISGSSPMNALRIEGDPSTL